MNNPQPAKLDEFKMAVEEAFQNNDVLPAGDLVVEMVKDLLKQGYRREDIVRMLDKFRVEFVEVGNENASDMVLGLMDRLTGWPSSKFRL